LIGRNLKHLDKMPLAEKASAGEVLQKSMGKSENAELLKKMAELEARVLPCFEAMLRATVEFKQSALIEPPGIGC
jgi:hypothetical protein